MAKNQKKYTQEFKQQLVDLYNRSITEYVSFLNNNLDNYMVRQMCKALKFARSTYYEVFHVFGLKFSYSIMLILVAIVVATITLPFAYKAFRKHQVA